MKTEELETLSKIIKKLRYYEWAKIRNAIDKKFSSEQAKTMITASSDDIRKAIELEI